MRIFCRFDVKARSVHGGLTAWHLVDWVWEDIRNSEDLMTRLQDTAGLLKKLSDFQKYVMRECDSLRLCGQIANGSKHCLLTHKPDTKISAKMSDGEGYTYGNPIIIDEDRERFADQVFHDVKVWFELFLLKWSVFPEEPWVPIDDSIPT